METNILPVDIKETDINEMIGEAEDIVKGLDFFKKKYRLLDLLDSVATLVETDYISREDAYEEVCDNPPSFEP